MSGNLRQALRALGRRPKFSFLLVLTLALGIGSATSVFSVVDTVLLRSLPYRNADRLISVWQTYPQWRNKEILHDLWERIPLSYPEYQDWRERQTSFEAVALYGSQQSTLAGDDRPRRVSVGLATHTFFPLLGVQPALGRLISPQDELPEAAKVAVLSHRLWQGAFGGDPSSIGSRFRLDGQVYTVIGVLPASFRFRNTATSRVQWDQYTASPESDLWKALATSGRRVYQRGNRAFEALALLKENASLQEASLETASILRGDSDPSERGARLLPRLAEETRQIRAPLLVLLAAAGLLLLISCNNAAGLLLGEAVERRREIAIRSCLGATRPRIVAQLLTESLLLAVVAGVAGVALALAGSAAFHSFAPAGMPRLESIAVDGRILAFSLLITLFAAAAFGMAPALSLVGPKRAGDLNKRFLPGGLRQGRLQAGLITGQIGFCFVLLVGAALLSQSLARLLAVDPGFRPQQVLTLRLDLPARSAQAASAGLFFQQAVQAVRSLPGVQSVGAVSHLPLSGQRQSNSVRIEGRTGSQDEPDPEAERRTAMPGYFRSAGIPLIEGRLFDQRDQAGSLPATVVSRALALRFWPGQSALGKRLGYDGKWHTVIGVVGDTLQTGLQEEAAPMFYLAHAQHPVRQMSLLIKHVGEASAVAQSARQQIWKLDPNLAVTEVATMDAVVSRSVSGQRYGAYLVNVFAFIASALAVFGLFTTTSRTISRCGRELGIRMALGANRRNILSLVLNRALLIVSVGVALGSAASFWLSSLLASLLYEIGPRDLRTYLACALFITAASLAAAYLPARHASRLNPVAVLRAE